MSDRSVHQKPSHEAPPLSEKFHDEINSCSQVFPTIDDPEHHRTGHVVGDKDIANLSRDDKTLASLSAIARMNGLDKKAPADNPFELSSIGGICSTAMNARDTLDNIDTRVQEALRNNAEPVFVSDLGKGKYIQYDATPDWSTYDWEWKWTAPNPSAYSPLNKMILQALKDEHPQLKTEVMKSSYENDTQFYGVYVSWNKK